MTDMAAMDDDQIILAVMQEFTEVGEDEDPDDIDTLIQSFADHTDGDMNILKGIIKASIRYARDEVSA
jgi:hypothetical protein